MRRSLLMVALLPAVVAACPFEIRSRAEGGGVSDGGGGGVSDGGAGGGWPAGSVGTGCVADAACQRGLLCSQEVEGGLCSAPCSVDGDCPGGTVCLAAFGSGLCVRPCDTAGDCLRAGFACASIPGLPRACLPPEGAGGAGGGGCTGAGALGADCFVDCDCAGSEIGRCFGGTCTQSCTTHADCPAQTHCAAGGCVAGARTVRIGEVCQSDADCGTDERCTADGVRPQGLCQQDCTFTTCPDGWACAPDRVCVPSDPSCPPTVDPTGQSCSYSYDCPACGVCSIGACAVPCPHGDADCPAGRTCDTFDWLCE